MNPSDPSPVFTDDELLYFIQTEDQSETDALLARALAARRAYYGNRVFFRGLIEISNYCKNDCYYCGLRRSNNKLERYRLTGQQILDCCCRGDTLGFKTFVLQGGEDSYYDDDRLCGIVRAIRQAFPAHAITLSLGERSRESYQDLKEAGADRYLLRHETADASHYSCLHPPELRLSTRLQCLYTLKEMGFQVGAGFMVGSPGQTPDTLLQDLRFLRDLQPHMVGVGPFLPQSDTPFGDRPAGSLSLTLKMVALVRLLLPHALIPATTALGSVAPDGREQGLLAGANVVMPNLSPSEQRRKYALYDNKVSIGPESAEGLSLLIQRIESLGFTADMSRGDPACGV